MRHPNARPAPLRAPAAVLLALSLPLSPPLLGACATARKEQAGVDALLEDGRFDEAARRAAALAERFPDDPEAQRRHLRASVAWYLERARRMTFLDRDEEALEYVDKALALAPDNVVVKDWAEKVHSKLNFLWLQRALDLEAEGQLDAALEAFNKAVEHDPDDEQAVMGAARILVAKNYRAGLGEEYYQEGVRRLREALLEQARQKFSYATKYLPEDERAQNRREYVKRQIAGERLAIAKNFEKRHLFAAAKIEYRIVLLLDPGNPEAEAGLERVETEVLAQAKLDEADMLVRKDRLEDAAEALEEGYELTEAQVEAFDRQRIDIEENVLQAMYDRAYDLESDFRFEEAVEAYEALLEEADYYKDAIARKETLEEYIVLADRLYERMLAAETDEERLDLLLQIEVFWPEYRDVSKRLKKLEPERR